MKLINWIRRAKTKIELEGVTPDYVIMSKKQKKELEKEFKWKPSGWIEIFGMKVVTGKYLRTIYLIDSTTAILDKSKLNKVTRGYLRTIGCDLD